MKFDGKLWSLNKTQKRFLKFVENWLFGSKNKIFRFWTPFWILTPSWISASKFKRLKIFFGSMLNVLHPKIVGNFPDRWRCSRFLCKKMLIWRHLEFWPPFWIFVAILYFLIKIWCFLKKTPFTELKNVLPLIYWNFSKIGLLKSAILVYAAILNYFHKLSSMICLHLKAKQNVEGIFGKS